MRFGVADMAFHRVDSYHSLALPHFNPRGKS